MRSLWCCLRWLVLLLPLPTLLWALTTSPSGGNGSSASVSSDSCRIESVLPRVESRAKEFVDNVNQFTATEILERARLGRDGKQWATARTKTHYVAEIRRRTSGVFEVNEYRSRIQGPVAFDEYIEADVAPALSLVFHPSHAEEFDMACDGPADWYGHSTWQIQFQQRLDRPATMSALQVRQSYFDVLLKGTAWIDRENYQVLHLEADLLRPIPKIRLSALHQSVDYKPVTFTRSGITMWLPWRAEITADFRGKILLERHTYSEFRLFWVDTAWKAGQPNAPSDERGEERP